MYSAIFLTIFFFHHPPSCDRACKFRLEFKIDQDSFKPIDIVKQTELGRQQLETWVKLIVMRGIHEAKETLKSKKAASPVLAPTVFIDF